VAGGLVRGSSHMPLGSEWPDVDEVVDLAGLDGFGPVWGVATEDLNATLLRWGPGEGVAEHVNAERDVLIVVIEGGGELSLDGTSVELVPDRAIVVRKGARRSVRAGDEGLRYLSVHLRRDGLAIEPLASGGG
ncbi:MAG: cupin domain-containing protein, partial [Solirubrobacteraceae bacterium]